MTSVNLLACLLPVFPLCIRCVYTWHGCFHAVYTVVLNIRLSVSTSFKILSAASVSPTPLSPSFWKVHPDSVEQKGSLEVTWPAPSGFRVVDARSQQMSTDQGPGRTLRSHLQNVGGTEDAGTSQPEQYTCSLVAISVPLTCVPWCPVYLATHQAAYCSFLVASDRISSVFPVLLALVLSSQHVSM